MRRVISRKDMGQTVKQCDGKLSNLLQTFQVCRQFVVRFTVVTHRLQVALAIDARLEQIKAIKKYQERGSHNDTSLSEVTPPTQVVDTHGPSHIEIIGTSGYHDFVRAELRAKRQRQFCSLVSFVGILVFAVYLFPWYAFLFSHVW